MMLMISIYFLIYTVYCHFFSRCLIINESFSFFFHFIGINCNNHYYIYYNNKYKISINFRNKIYIKRMIHL